jgi:two-component system response regulator
MNKSIRKRKDIRIVDILMIEDNPYDAELTQLAFKKYHLADRLAWVKDGEAALEFIFGSALNTMEPISLRPSLILLDLKLPKVDGHEVLCRLKEDPRTRSIPVVILTSSREEIDIIDAYKSGVNSYIVKPVEFEKFTMAVQHVCLYWLLLNQMPEKTSRLNEV